MKPLNFRDSIYFCSYIYVPTCLFSFLTALFHWVIFIMLLFFLYSIRTLKSAFSSISLEARGYCKALLDLHFFSLKNWLESRNSTNCQVGSNLRPSELETDIRALSHQISFYESVNIDFCFLVKLLFTIHVLAESYKFS